MPTLIASLGPRLTLHVTLASGFCLLGCLSGCEQSPPAAPVQVNPPPSPQVRFEKFLSELRRLVEGDASSPGAYSADGATYTGSYRLVGHELIEPETSEGVLRATITIRENASFTLYPSDDEPIEEESTDISPQLPDDLAGLEGELEDLASGPRRQIGPAPVQTRAHADDFEYSLAYVEGRWRVKVGPDPDKNLFLSEAFRIAIERQ